MHYREIEPSPALRPFVRCFWHLLSSEALAEPSIERILPDGCPEIVLSRAEPFQRLDAGGVWRAQASVLLVGQMRGPVSIAPTGTVDLLGIRFEPAGLFALLGVPMHEITDEDFCVGQVDPEIRARLEAAGHAAGLTARVAAVEAELLRELGARDARAGLARAAVQRIEAGASTVEALARGLGVGRRGLERLFRLEVGLSPKLYIRIRRLQAVLTRLDGGRAPTWATLAAAHGYADQAHMIRDFRLLAGTTPARYLAERTPLAGFFEALELSRSSNTQDRGAPTFGSAIASRSNPHGDRRP